MAPTSSSEDRLIALADTFIATRVRMEALSEKLDHVANKLAKAITDLDQLQDRVAQLEFARKFSGSWWKWALALVAGLGAVLGMVQTAISILSR